MMQIDSRQLFMACMTKLQKLEARHHPEHGRYKELYFEVVDCIRTYLNMQYGLEMKNCTTQELERILRRLRGPSELIQGLREIFDEHERVQYGQWLPSLHYARCVPDWGRRLLTMLAPLSVRQQQTSPGRGSTEVQQTDSRGHGWIMPIPQLRQEQRAT